MHIYTHTAILALSHPGSREFGSRELGSRDFGSRELGSRDLGSRLFVFSGVVNQQKRNEKKTHHFANEMSIETGPRETHD